MFLDSVVHKQDEVGFTPYAMIADQVWRSKGNSYFRCLLHFGFKKTEMRAKKLVDYLN